MPAGQKHGENDGTQCTSGNNSSDSPDTATQLEAAADQQQRQQQPTSPAAAAASDAVALRSKTTAAVQTDSRIGLSWIQRWMQQPPPPQQQRSQLLNWRLTFRHPDVELSYWQQRCEQRLMLLDKLVMFQNMLVLLNVASSRPAKLDCALHAVSLLLLLAQGAVMARGAERYVRHRPRLILLQRLWRAVLRLQQLHPAAAAAALVAAADATAQACAGTAASAADHAPAAAAAAAAAAFQQDAGLDSSPWQLFFDSALVASGVAPAWAYAWAYQTPFGTAPLLQICCLLLVLAAEAGRLLQLLAAPQLQHCIAATYNAASGISNLLLLPLLPVAGMPAAGACPALPALPVLLWLQLFWAMAAPMYVLYCFERSSKVWFWLQRLAAMPAVPDDLASEAQQLLRQVRPRRAVLRHALLLLLLAALTWQACELAYWLLPHQLLQPLLRTWY
uniref:Uncharacterized protein n=1 Tax=Tetradesmus obliquus TaxID=3088 RepID=A0A383WGK2_TETOB|eukprot:jgi/Sobl393_1/16975/SZX76393.1